MLKNFFIILNQFVQAGLRLPDPNADNQLPSQWPNSLTSRLSGGSYRISPASLFIPLKEYLYKLNAYYFMQPQTVVNYKYYVAIVHNFIISYNVYG